MRKPVFSRCENVQGRKTPSGDGRAPGRNGFADCGCKSQGNEGACPGTSAPKKHGLMAFQEIYRSRDGRMCLFADERTGHLAAVDSSRFA